MMGLSLSLYSGDNTDSARLTIQRLEIKGASFFRQGTLKKLMVSRPGWLWQRRYYRPELLQEDLEKLRRSYRQQGFLEAKILSYDVNTDSLRQTVEITLTVSEGERTFIEGIHLFGNQAFPDSVLEEQLTVDIGQPLIARNIDQTQNALMQFYAERGYLDAQVTVDVKANPESHRAILDFTVSEAGISRLEHIITQGLRSTRPYVVYREMKMQSGNVIQYSKLLQSQRQLYLTGLFQYVYVRPAPLDSLYQINRDVIVDVQEHEYGEFNVSGGYGSEDKFRIRMEIAHKNLGGTARKAGLQSWLSFIQRGITLSASDPWLFQKPLKADINLTAEFKDEPGYDIYRSGGQGILGRQLGDHSDIRLTLRQDFTRYSHIESLPETRAKANIRSMKGSVTYDTRDNLFHPQRGVYAAWSYELARAVFDSPVLFHRWEAGIKGFRKFSACVFGTGIEFGWLRTGASIASIPPDERYYAGGQGSVRGFDFKKIGPLNEGGVPTGGLLKLVWRIGEIRFPLYRILNGAVFCDSGNCWTSARHVRFSGLRFSAGAGLRLHTFLGIVRMDYAWKLNRRSGEKAGAFVFNMGHAF